MLPQGSSIRVIDNEELWVSPPTFFLHIFSVDVKTDLCNKAPDVSLIGDTYYAFYCVSRIGFQGSDIGVATSHSADVGTWTDHGSIGIPKSSQYNLIDPNLFKQCPTCPEIFTFGSAWGMIFQTTLNGDSTSWSGQTPYQVAYNGTGGSFQEGSFQFWWPVGGTNYYYLFFSSGDCCDTPVSGEFWEDVPFPGILRVGSLGYIIFPETLVIFLLTSS
jgi:arabinan endo-1,5-alpha-L-arabinosidase